MIPVVRTALPVLLALLCSSETAFASRSNFTERDAWANPSVVIVRGSVGSVDYAATTARYQVRVLETLKPRAANLRQLTITDPNWKSTAAISLRMGGEFLLFLLRSGDDFQSYREFDLDARQVFYPFTASGCS